MQVNQGGVKGSFGIPEHMKAAIAQAERDKANPPAPRPQEDERMPKAYADDGFDTGEPSENTDDKVSEEDKIKVKDPVQFLKDEYDIEITSEDIQRIIFKGYTEKDVIILPSVMGAPALVATFKTLTGNEYELADEKLAEEIRDIRMTNDGFAARRGVWLLAYGLKKIQGKMYYTPLYLDTAKKVLDKKGTLEARKQKLGDFSPVVLSKMMEIQSNITIAINYIFANAKGEAVKKP